MINVTKTFLPPIEEYDVYLRKIWKNEWITNNGEFAQELERTLKEYLGVNHLIFVTNGTIALQIAIKALELKGEIITTPFSYVATTSSIFWENCQPIFADIDPKTLCIDPAEVEKKITSNTSAILATHVYGNPCDLKRLEELGKKYSIRIIYDAAHAFGVKLNGNSILNWGDVSTLSFHATKVFHTVEGGALVTSDDALAHRISYMRNFGHKGTEQFWGVGINGKNSEFHSAMGLLNLKHFPGIVEKRKEISAYYDRLLTGCNVTTPLQPAGLTYNYAYYPVIFASEAQLLKAVTMMKEVNIFPRRYFFPSLNRLPYIQNQEDVGISEEISKLVLCLPLSHSLDNAQVEMICGIVKKAS